MKDEDAEFYVRGGDELPEPGVKFAFSRRLEFTPNEIFINGYKIRRTDTGFSVGFHPGGHGGTGPNVFKITEQEYESLARLANEFHNSFTDAVHAIEKSKTPSEFWREK